MTATVATDLKANFKYYMDRVLDGDQVIITRPKHKNVVLISEDEYNELRRVKEHEKQHAAQILLSRLNAAKERAEKEGWINSDEVEKMMGIDL